MLRGGIGKLQKADKPEIPENPLSKGKCCIFSKLSQLNPNPRGASKIVAIPNENRIKKKCVHIRG